MTDKDMPEFQDADRNPADQPEMGSEKPAQPSPSSDDDVTKKIRVVPESPESDWELMEKPNGYDSHPSDQNGQSSEWIPETDAPSGHVEEIQPDQLDGSNGWWGDVPFTPIEDVHAEDTRPITPLGDDQEATRAIPPEGDDADLGHRILPEFDEDETHIRDRNRSACLKFKTE